MLEMRSTTTTSSTMTRIDPDDDFDSEIDDAIESVTGMRYDPEVAPILPDGRSSARMSGSCWRRLIIGEPGSRCRTCGSRDFHVIVENQVAMGDELPVRRTIERLMGEVSIATTRFMRWAACWRRT